MTDQNNLHEEGAHIIPGKIRSFVYIVGMLGFPVVIASYILVVTSNDIRAVQNELKDLATRIDERPMGLDKTSDFIIYLTSSLENELLVGIPDLMGEIVLESEPTDMAIERNVATIQQHIETYIRPIVRKHKRFAERFPSIGGNIGTYFNLSAPAEDIAAGNIDAYLTGQVLKDFSESLYALMSNRIVAFGHPMISTQPENPEGEDILLVDKSVITKQFEFAISSAITGLRDQMLQKVRLQSTELNEEI